MPAPASALLRRPPPPAGAFILADVALVALSVVLAVWLRGLDALNGLWAELGLQPQHGLDDWGARHWALLFLQVMALPPTLWLLGQYRVYREPGAEWDGRRILAAVTAVSGFALAALVMLGGATLPRTVYVIQSVLLLGALSLARCAWSRRVRQRHARGLDLSSVLLIGDHHELEEVAASMRDPRRHGRRIVGQFTWSASGSTDDAALATLVADNLSRHRIHLDGRFTGTRADLSRVLAALMVEAVFVGTDCDEKTIDEVIAACHPRGIEIHLLARRPRGVRPTPWFVGDNVALSIHRLPISRIGWAQKRSLDIMGAAIGLLLFSPILLASAIAIKIEHHHQSVFYQGLRCGFKGHPFKMHKLSTMVTNAQELEKGLRAGNEREGPWFKLDPGDDPRITKVGRFLRRFTLNEVPQFWNVLKGEMSLVGPRPPTPDEVASYLHHDIGYYRVLDVKPGMTGLWQVTARSDPSFDRRLQLDLEYMATWSIWLDFAILLKTFGVAFGRGE